MANEEHLDILKQGVNAWNKWRYKNPEIQPDLSEADFCEADLRGAYLARANLSKSRLIGVELRGANLDRANLSKGYLREANLFRAYLGGADLSGADLRLTNLVETNLEKANLENCRVYGISAWNLKGKPEKQSNLIITNDEEPIISVDNLEVAQFIYLLLNNQKIRDVINTITTKAVLILGRFTPERKAILDAIREELRKQNYLPILFDFEIPANRDITETATLLARMARFIIADLTEPSSIPKELEAIVPTLAVPVQPLLEGSTRPYSMFKDYWKYDWVLSVHRYQNLNDLLASLREKVITPAEAKVKELEKKRNEATS
jgi:pentapeptide repeat protein